MNPIKEIEPILEKYYDAFNYKDWITFGNFLDDNFRYFTDNCIVQTKDEFLDFLKRDKWQGKNYILSNLNAPADVNSDFVAATYKIEFNGSFDNQQITVSAIETMILTKRNDEWKILHCHTSNKIHKH